MGNKRGYREEPCDICGHAHDVSPLFGCNLSFPRLCSPVLVLVGCGRKSLHVLVLPCCTVAVITLLVAKSEWCKHRSLRLQYHGHERCGECGHMKGEFFVHNSRRHLRPVLDDFIYVGSYDDSCRLEHLKQVGVTHMLNVSQPAPFLAFPLDNPKILLVDDQYNLPS